MREKRSARVRGESPPRIWMLNDVGGYIDVYPDYLYIKFAHSRRRCFRIDGVGIYRQLFQAKGEFADGELIFIPILSKEGEKQMSVLIERSKNDKDLALVNQNELKEALYFYIG